MLSGISKKRDAQAQSIAITMDEGQGLGEIDNLQNNNPTLYRLALVLRVGFFVALVVKSLTLWHW